MSKSSKEPFLQVSYKLLESTNLNSNQKLLISYIISWQHQNKECRVSNKALATKFGVSLTTIKDWIKELNKKSFFTSCHMPHHNEYGTYVNTKVMVVDEMLLNEYLEDESKPVVQPKKENRARQKADDLELGFSFGHNAEAFIN